MSEAEKRRQVQVDIKCLQILRAIIYNQIVQIDPELKEREPVKYRAYVYITLCKVPNNWLIRLVCTLHSRQCEVKIHPVQKSVQSFDNAISRVSVDILRTV